MLLRISKRVSGAQAIRICSTWNLDEKKQRGKFAPQGLGIESVVIGSSWLLHQPIQKNRPNLRAKSWKSKRT